MYLHIGKSFTVREKDIIGIFDLDNASKGKLTGEFLKRAEQDGNIIDSWDEFPKSMVLVCDRGIYKIYLSDLSSTALAGRMNEQ